MKVYLKKVHCVASLITVLAWASFAQAEGVANNPPENAHNDRFGIVEMQEAVTSSLSDFAKTNPKLDVYGYSVRVGDDDEGALVKVYWDDGKKQVSYFCHYHEHTAVHGQHNHNENADHSHQQENAAVANQQDDHGHQDDTSDHNAESSKFMVCHLIK